MDYNRENSDRRFRPEMPIEMDPEEIRLRAMQELRDENLRHEEAMRRLNKQHEDGMRTVKTSSWKGLGCCFGNLFCGSSGPRTSTEPHAEQTWSEDDQSRLGDGRSGRCLIIWNRSGDCTEESASLVKGFSRLGFDVRIRKNMTDAEVRNILSNVTKETVQFDGSFFLVFVGRGTSDYIQSANDKKIKIGSVVEMFNPRVATGIRHCSKVLLFQCDVDSRRMSVQKNGDPTFSPKYDDAFVLSSTHSNFLTSLEGFMKTTTKIKFQNFIDDVVDSLIEGCTAQETINIVSTLRSEIVLNLRKGKMHSDEATTG